MNDLSRAFRAMWWRSAHVDAACSPEHELAPAFWSARMTEMQLACVVSDGWTGEEIERRPLAGAGRVLFSVRHPPRADEAVLEVDGALAYVTRDFRGRVSVVVAARSDDEGARVLLRLREAFPKRQAPLGCRREMKFWSYTGHGASSRDETVDVCRWEDLAPNYGARTRAQLDALMTTPEVTETGKLVLWLGPPGTGKTFALRALAWEQKKRVTVHYILDPEVFLERIDYVMSVFRDDDADGDDDDDDDDDDGRAKVARRARLIVLEDAGELLGADAMSRSGHGLSRLLNLTDGLPGQATRTRVLITTNEDVGRLHPAVTRSGRCGALVRFAALDDAEATAWLRSRDREDLVPDLAASSTIADLYARLRGDARAASASASSQVGFARLR